MTAQEISKAFVQHYYTTMASNREGLMGLYGDESVLTLETSECRGRNQIMEKILALTYQKIQHDITSIDHQMISSDSVLVVVTGRLKTDDDPPNSFTQTFVLRQGSGGIFIANEVFRVILHNN
ncbi:unnamed protein product [Clavelina lepadiformis]|uniref:Nuclear transport factor 2 n=1 Tax=Clavelina lepadiformis TaxID=159417 RepID=A0ABP0FZP5_CLALP